MILFGRVYCGVRCWRREEKGEEKGAKNLIACSLSPREKKRGVLRARYLLGRSKFLHQLDLTHVLDKADLRTYLGPGKGSHSDLSNTCFAV